MNTNNQPRTFKPIKKQAFFNKRSAKKTFSSIKNTNCNDTKLFIGGIPPDTDRSKSPYKPLEELMSFFSQYGELLDVYVPVHKKKKCLKGFAFVAFQSKTAYLKALEIKEFTLRGKTMTARAALQEKVANSVTKNLQQQKLFVKGFPADTKEAAVQAFFEKFARVDRVLMCRDKKRNFRGFAYVVMKTKEGYQRVLALSEANSEGVHAGEFKFKGNRLYVSKSKTQKEINSHRKKQKNILKMFVDDEKQNKKLERAASGVNRSINGSQKKRIKTAKRRGSVRIRHKFIWMDIMDNKNELTISKIPDFFHTNQKTAQKSRKFSIFSNEGKTQVRQHCLLFKAGQQVTLPQQEPIEIDGNFEINSPIKKRPFDVSTIGASSEDANSVSDNYCLRVKVGFN
jgi:hypothetical protein